MEKAMYYLYLRELGQKECPESHKRIMATIVKYNEGQDGKLINAVLVEDQEDGVEVFQKFLKEKGLEQQVVPIYAKNKDGV